MALLQIRRGRTLEQSEIGPLQIFDIPNKLSQYKACFVPYARMRKPRDKDVLNTLFKNLTLMDIGTYSFGCKVSQLVIRIN